MFAGEKDTPIKVEPEYGIASLFHEIIKLVTRIALAFR